MVLRFFLKAGVLVVVRLSSGRLFQAVGPASPNGSYRPVPLIPTGCLVEQVDEVKSKGEMAYNLCSAYYETRL